VLLIAQLDLSSTEKPVLFVWLPKHGTELTALTDVTAEEFGMYPPQHAFVPTDSSGTDGPVLFAQVDKLGTHS
jgi:hypothetical protein